mgnify:CR=1 FL=1|jgi:hypothetical protein
MTRSGAESIVLAIPYRPTTSYRNISRLPQHRAFVGRNVGTQTCLFAGTNKSEKPGSESPNVRTLCRERSCPTGWCIFGVSLSRSCAMFCRWWLRWRKARESSAWHRNMDHEIVKRSDTAKGFVVLPGAGLSSERWLGSIETGASPRTSERTIASATAWLFIAPIQLLTRRFAKNELRPIILIQAFNNLKELLIGV